MNIEINKLYLWKNKSGRILIVVRVTEKNKLEFRGDVIYTIKNEDSWRRTGIGLPEYGFQKEVSEETHPEVFL